MSEHDGSPIYVDPFALDDEGLAGFRNRLSVFRQWAWTYITLNDGARLITGSQELPGWDKHSSLGEETLALPLDLGSPKSN